MLGTLEGEALLFPPVEVGVDNIGLLVEQMGVETGGAEGVERGVDIPGPELRTELGVFVGEFWAFPSPPDGGGEVFTRHFRARNISPNIKFSNS